MVEGRNVGKCERMYIYGSACTGVADHTVKQDDRLVDED